MLKEKIQSLRLENFFIVGILSIVISGVTWAMDFFHIVDACIYCRNERTIIGLLGVLMIVPLYYHLRLYFTIALGFYGSLVAAEQVFVYLMDAKYSIMFYLAICAFFIMIAQVYIIIYYLCFFKNTKILRTF